MRLRIQIGDQTIILPFKSLEELLRFIEDHLIPEDEIPEAEVIESNSEPKPSVLP